MRYKYSGLMLVALFTVALSLAGCNTANPTEPVISTVSLPTATNTISPTKMPTIVPTSIPQPTITPIPIKISAENVNKIEVLNQWGKGWINNLQFDSTGKNLLVGSSVGAFLLDWKTGEGPQIITERSDYVGFSPDKSTITQIDYKFLSFYDTKTNMRTGPLINLKQRVYQPQVDPLNKDIFAVNSSNQVSIWDIGKKEEIHTFYGHYNDVNDLAFCGISQILFSASKDKTIIGWDVAKKNRLKTYTGFTSSVEHVACSQDGKYLVGVDSNGLLQVWDLDTNSKISKQLEEDKVIQFTVANQSHYSAISMDNGQIKLYNLAEGAVISTIQGDSTKIRYLAFSPDDSILAGASWEGEIYLWNTQTGQIENTISGFSTPASLLQVSPDNKYLLVGIGEELKLFDPKSLMEIRSLSGKYYVDELKFSPDRKYLASFNGTGSMTLGSEVIIYDMNTLSQYLVLPTIVEVYESLKYSSDSKMLAVWGVSPKKKTSYIEIWDMETGDLLKQINGECYDLSFSEDGTQIACGYGKILHVFDTSSWTEIRRFDLKKYNAGPLEFSADGKTITIDAYRIQDKNSGKVSINLETGEITPGEFNAQVAQDDDKYFSSVPSPDGLLTYKYMPSYMDCCGLGYTTSGLRIYLNSTNELIKEIALPVGKIQAVAFSPDQSNIYVATSEGPIYLLGLKR
jgi:WD40 repeat protein